MNERSRIARMTCPGCGTEMNPHAEKPMVPPPDAEDGPAGWLVVGIIEEVHQCPACGHMESRRV
jgi:predicted RNA-binding Zn-ribbon protein involved in translation (DUF1610 family)